MTSATTPGVSAGRNSRRTGVETRTIEAVPASERHGTPRSLFTLWFSANMQVTAIVTGALAIVLGLSWTWAIVAIIVGNLVGAVFMALHSVQGPRLGLPQMIQSRAQFGYLGALLPMLLAIILYLGFFATSAVLGGLALAGWWGVSTTIGIVLSALLCVVLAVVGYDLIHRYQHAMSYLFTLAFAYLTIRMLVTHGVGQTPASPFAWSSFLAVTAIVATWQITYAVAVSDYSRYLPVETGADATFWLTYAGTVIGTIWMMLLGCLAAVLGGNAFNANPVAYLAGQAGALVWLLYLVILLGVVSANVINVYGSLLCVASSTTAIVRLRMTQQIRIGFILAATVAGTAIAIWGQGHFLTNYGNFLTFLIVLVVPWTAVNLTDFYLLRHGNYNVAGLVNPRGAYPAWGWQGLFAYVIAVVVELPFINSLFYQGPFSRDLGGADISWIVGLIVSTGAYLGLTRLRPVRVVRTG